MSQPATSTPPASAAHWFRVYNAVVDDPKVQQLPDALFKALVNLWCLASQNGGTLPPTDTVAYRLRMKPARAAEILARLVAAGLIDDHAGVFVPHNWGTRQYKRGVTDVTSAERSRRYRARKRDAGRDPGRDANVTVTPQESEQIRSEQSTAEARDVSKSDEDRLRQAIAGAFMAAKAPSVPDTARAGVWLRQGYDAGIILAVVTEIVARKPRLASLNYFDGPIRDAHADKAPVRIGPTLVQTAADIRIEDAVKMFARTHHWSRHAGPAPGLAGCRAPAALLAQFGLLPDGRPNPAASRGEGERA
ncbi:hypothetical protein [Bradyrhizobium prioriisuperbiae]|uniref:hypothetical protein n=1 Tax=Bradyrhizobium prioriisuperbiae TaxID=2854389 RepID=UPI0028E2AAD8|nr:hypothetical protein [Bradyrhizobium prioritasuperba]